MGGTDWASFGWHLTHNKGTTVRMTFDIKFTSGLPLPSWWRTKEVGLRVGPAYPDKWLQEMNKASELNKWHSVDVTYVTQEASGKFQLLMFDYVTVKFEVKNMKM